MPCNKRIHHLTAAAGNSSAGTASGLPFADLMQAIQAQLQGQSSDEGPPSAEIEVQNLSYHPAGNVYTYPHYRAQDTCNRHPC